MKHLKVKQTLSMTLAVAMIVGLAARAQAQSPDQTPRNLDGTELVARSIETKVGDAREFKHSELFANARFLRLKRGDKLVKGKKWFEDRKGGQPRFAETDSYYLQSGDKFYHLQLTSEKAGWVSLGQSHYSVLFDWKVSLKNAAKLLEIYPEMLGEPITLAKFNELKVKLAKDFPETVATTPDVEIMKPYLVEGSGKTNYAVFQGLGYDRFRNTIFKYQVEIGNGRYIQTRTNVLVGPPRIHRRMFEKIATGGPNAGIYAEPDKETAAKNRAAFDRMVAFQTAINPYLVTPLQPSAIAAHNTQ